MLKGTENENVFIKFMVRHFNQYRLNLKSGFETLHVILTKGRPHTLLACPKAGLHCVSNSSKIYRFPTEEKFIMNLSNVCSLNTLFTLICTILTLLLICQELFTFAVVKPTTTSQEEKELETNDLPDVVFCLDPAFDSVNLTRFGYRRDSYFRGSQSWMDGDFVGCGDYNLQG